MYIGGLPVPLTAQIVEAPPDFTGRCPVGAVGWYSTVIGSESTHGGSSALIYNVDRMRYELTGSLSDSNPTSVWSTGPTNCYGAVGSTIFYTPQAQNQVAGLTVLRNGVPYGCNIDQTFGRDIIAQEFFYCGS